MEGRELEREEGAESTSRIHYVRKKLFSIYQNITQQKKKLHWFNEMAIVGSHQHGFLSSINHKIIHVLLLWHLKCNYH